MEITKRRDKKAEKIWNGECRECGSEATATEGELTHVHNDQRDGSFSWEKCPASGAGGSTGYGGMIFYPPSPRNFY